ncbi:tryptophan-rich conserved hypothetical protein [Rubidibacter lacunae KORDI 51-2]|uniref:TIGR02450 family Trp-rich protein n=1 Tax=Rubidibacter lacunae KORDI 51-2 TaxID=582515 RepID=U5DEW9_9CHRO|nr:TIGR02450 family Trp-rich protein [Rubidibacter lacunae]ERN43043.1 tryptophan-rich conserved hypothetical protein [Rubidibacter lacunae KORDI 51-2]
MPVQKRHMIGSKWTARQTTWGWRHFQVVNCKNHGRWVFAELVASCDDSIRFWLNAQQLRDPNLWQTGWKTLAEMNAPANDFDPDLTVIE